MYWYQQTTCYHIYPLGCFGCEPHHIDTPISRITKLIDWIPHFQKLGIDSLYLGPIFESEEHGYDTIDYFTLDHRLGTNEDLEKVCQALHEAGIHIILDGVFHHVGRSFFAFQDVLKNREHSPYLNWFESINFYEDSPYHDGFSYACWEGHYNLVKLNLSNEEVFTYLFQAIGHWMDYFHIDGLRLDAANAIAFPFFEKLHQFTKSKREDFFLLGEVIHGDYNRWANDTMLDSTTNYEAYKGLYSSFNTRNFFEIAYSFNREFGDHGIYKSLPLYNFVDNHDVSRIYESLENNQDLYNLYTLLFTMPGIPSIYYGSEWGIPGKKEYGSDASLRPMIDIQTVSMNQPELFEWICILSNLRKAHPALQHGDYAQIIIRNEQFIFQRTCEQERFCVACNLNEEDYVISFSSDVSMMDCLSHACYHPQQEEITIAIPAKSCVLLSSILEGYQKEEASVEPIITQTPPKEEKMTIPVEEPQDIVINGIYRHFKGNLYKVVGIATHSEDETKYVVYRQMYGDFQLWVRPLDMFMETIERDGITFKRFQFMFQQE